jgi:hypothetical protein
MNNVYDTFTVSTSYLSLIFNGDDSGLDTDDIETFNSWIEDIGLPLGHWSTDDESEFFSRCEICELGAWCTEIQWVELTSKSA